MDNKGENNIRKFLCRSLIHNIVYDIVYKTYNVAMSCMDIEDIVSTSRHLSFITATGMPSDYSELLNEIGVICTLFLFYSSY